MTFAYAYDPCFQQHVAPAGHPERADRLQAALEGLYAGGVSETQAPLPTRAATREELARVHTTEYLDRLEAAFRRAPGQLDADTFISAGTAEAALCAAGGAIDLTLEVLGGGAKRGFALVRPPGHHAEPDRGMGFCLLDNIALAAEAARAEGVERIAIVDWDVHHGNGTQRAFYDDPNVLFISAHQSPLYPGSGNPGEIGEGAGRGATINLAMPPACGDVEMWRAFELVVLPALDRFAPELVLVSAGFDGHAADPLANLELTAEGFGALAAAMRQVADTHAQGRLVATLEGGYHLAALRDSVCAVTQAWTAPECPTRPVANVGVHPEAQRAIDATLTALGL